MKSEFRIQGVHAPRVFILAPSPECRMFFHSIKLSTVGEAPIRTREGACVPQANE